MLLEKNDFWKHRSAGMRCFTCMYYVEKKQVKKDDSENSDTNSFGRCRRHAPALSGFPSVFGHDWCGDHKLDENCASAVLIGNTDK